MNLADLRWLAIDPRLISAAALLVIGLLLISFVARVWVTHPVNRVFLVGKFVTEDGLRLLFKNLPSAFALGLFAIAAGCAKIAYVERWKGHIASELADFFGIIEAIFAVWAASCVIIAAVRLCRRG